MKKVFLAGLLAAMSVLGMSNSVYSQSTAVSYTPWDNIKAMRSFKKMFTAVEGEKWYEYKGAYAAVFVSDDVRFRVEYDSRGNWSATEKDYYEVKLDRDIRKIVKSVYYDYSISSIREITTNEFFTEPVYVIHIEDANSFKNVIVYSGEMSVVDAYVKN